MAPFSGPHWIPPESQSSLYYHVFPRGLGAHSSELMGFFSPAQNHAILVTGLTTASVSLLAALVAFQWFALMKRSFAIISSSSSSYATCLRHSGTSSFRLLSSPRAKWKALPSSAKFPVSSLPLDTEASDYAILMVALCAALYVFRPPKKLVQGGLYPYRYWMYIFWVILPVLAASLGFISPTGYITAGTCCSLPKRPFWYCLAQ